MNKIIDICPKCGESCLQGEAKIDMNIFYDNGFFYYEDAGNEPIVDSWYCWGCGETFTREEVEQQAIKLTKEQTQ